MGAIIRRPRFVQDLNDAWRYLNERNPTAADDFLRQLERRYTLLADRPLIGATRLPRHKDYRLLPYRNHVLIYRPLDDETGIELIRLIHTARDYQRFF